MMMMNIAPPLPLFPPKTHFNAEVLKTHAKNEKRNICLKCSRIAEIPAYYGKLESGNTMLTSDF